MVCARYVVLHEAVLGKRSGWATGLSGRRERLGSTQLSATGNYCTTHVKVSWLNTKWTKHVVCKCSCSRK
eukprot:3915774-Amphidinium_carterae.1